MTAPALIAEKATVPARTTGGRVVIEREPGEDDEERWKEGMVAPGPVGAGELTNPGHLPDRAEATAAPPAQRPVIPEPVGPSGRRRRDRPPAARLPARAARGPPHLLSVESGTTTVSRPGRGGQHVLPSAPVGALRVVTEPRARTWRPY